MENQHQHGRDEEGGIASAGAEQSRLGIRRLLHERPGELLVHTHRLIAIYLNAVHRFEHHLVATQVDALHIEKTRHIAVERYMGGFQARVEGLGEVGGEIDDAMHLLVTQQAFGLGHGGAGMRDRHVRTGIPAMQEIAALG